MKFLIIASDGLWDVIDDKVRMSISGLDVLFIEFF